MIYPTNPWEPVDLAGLVVSAPGARNPDVLEAVVQQFDVVHAARYQGSGSTTWCNIFLWDVTRALGCEVPHWVDASLNPAPMGPPNRELSANAVCDWLEVQGARFGWMKVDGDLAQEAASKGEPVVIAWKNPSGGSGHVAIAVPDPSDLCELLSAQAGAVNFVGKPYTAGFGARPVSFYCHA